MFSKVALLAFVTPLVSALTLDIPQSPTSDGSVTVTWTATTTDNPFSLFLINDAFHDSFAIANNVDPSLQTLTLTLPTVPARDGYTLRATNPGNITDVFAETGSFSVGASTQTSSIASSTAASVSGSSTVSGSGTTSGSAAATSTRPAGTSSTFGVTVSNSASPTSGSASSSGTSSAASSSGSAFSGAAAQFGFSKAAVGAALLSVVAGAAVFGF